MPDPSPITLTKPQRALLELALANDAVGHVIDDENRQDACDLDDLGLLLMDPAKTIGWASESGREWLDDNPRRGRPRRGADGLTEKVLVRISRATANKLDDTAAAEGKSRATVAREILDRA